MPSNTPAAFSGRTVADFSSWLNDSHVFTGYYPADFIDLWPALMLQKHRYCRELVLIMPIGNMRTPQRRDLEQQIVRFCETGSIDAQGDLYRWTKQYGYSVKDIALRNPVPEESAQTRLNLQHPGSFSIVKILLSHKDYADVLLLIWDEDPSELWRRGPSTVDILIESGKGMGNWFTSVPLYRYIAMGPESLVPPYYMKGKYMSYDGPKGTHTECSEYDFRGSGIATEIRRVSPLAFRMGYMKENKN